jgi:site-specific DNA-methyltransferase (adenine-specific)
MNTQVLFSSKDEVWATPQDFFDTLNEEFHFTLDPCALPENAKCSKYFTPEDDGLQQDWDGEIVFCNPPYCRKVSDWVQKAYYESKKPNTRVVMLLAARTDTKWFHEYIYNKAELRFIKGRLKFGDNKRNAPFPSMIVIF